MKGMAAWGGPLDSWRSRRLYKTPVLRDIMPRVISKGSLRMMAALCVFVCVCVDARGGCLCAGYVFQMEVIVRAKQLGYSVGEVRRLLACGLAIFLC